MPAFQVNPAEDIVPLSIGKVPTSTGGLYVTVAGAFTFRTASGNSRTVTLTAGYHPIQIIELQAGSDIYAYIHK
jgi:hypothetical protein